MSLEAVKLESVRYKPAEIEEEWKPYITVDDAGIAEFLIDNGAGEDLVSQIQMHIQSIPNRRDYYYKLLSSPDADVFPFKLDYYMSPGEYHQKTKDIYIHPDSILSLCASRDYQDYGHFGKNPNILANEKMLHLLAKLIFDERIEREKTRKRQTSKNSEYIDSALKASLAAILGYSAAKYAGFNSVEIRTLFAVDAAAITAALSTHNKMKREQKTELMSEIFCQLMAELGEKPEFQFIKFYR